MNPTLDLVRDGLGQVVWLLAPAAGAAAGAAFVVGWGCHRFGVHDPAPVLLARASAVLAVLWLFGARWLADGASWTGDAWALLPAIGRGQ